MNLFPNRSGYWWRWKRWGRGKPAGRWYAVEVVEKADQTLRFGAGNIPKDDGLWGGECNRPFWIVPPKVTKDLLWTDAEVVASCNDFVDGSGDFNRKGIGKLWLVTDGMNKVVPPPRS